MNNRISIAGLSLLTAATLLFAGCDTFQARAREKSATYESLDAGTQNRLERGRIAPGDTQDMVYIALGNPDEKRELSTADGTHQTWIYRSYWQQYEGTAWVGYRRIILPAANGRGFVVFHEPVTQDIYRTHVDDVIRVTFASNGVVSTVDQTNRR